MKAENRVRCDDKVYEWLSAHKKKNSIISLNAVVRKLIVYWVEQHKTKLEEPKTEVKEAING